MDIIESYKNFLKNGKTERECTSEIIRLAEEKGYKDINKVEKLKAGDRVYISKWNKSVALFHIGSEPIEKGMNILGAHIDSPRLDIKQNPLYESDFIVYLNTHYYGGIKKYQWVTIPLALHGVVCLKDGKTININVGEKDDDPVFCISDILPHLAQKQMEGNAREFIPGEILDLICGSSSPDSEEESDEDKKKEKESAKKNILKILKDKYGIEEKDFNSAELEVVPAGAPRDLGFDRSLILAYGQDDRSCAYTSVQAILDTEKTDKTLCCLCVDKEEIGSVGASGMQSRFFENAVAEILHALGGYSGLSTRRCLANSYMLSSDVSSAFDSLYASAYDKKNCAYLGKGMVLMKFTGSRGKSGSNDASAEYLGRLRAVLDKHKVSFQTAELGRVDLGGGGTIAYIMSLYGMNVIDSGVAVLSMHAPWEAVSKVDVYEAYKGYKAFLQEI